MIEKLIIKLINSISNDNLEITINIIDALKNKELTLDETNKLQKSLFPLLLHNEQINNKSIDYILENLNFPFYKNILFLREYNQMKQETNLEIIENYIQQLLDAKEYPYAESEQQVIRFLVSLVPLLKDKDKISNYSNQIQNKFFNGKEV